METPDLSNLKINWKLIIGKYIKILISSFVAGIVISLSSMGYFACIAYSNGNFLGNVVGSLLFATGIIIICLYGYNLFTGKVDYIPDNKPIYLLEVLLTWIGNYIGTLVSAALVCCTHLMDEGDNFNNAIIAYSENRIDSHVLSLIVLSILCGLLIYFAINTYKKAEQPIARFLLPFVCSTIFMISGLDHCIADMFVFDLYAIKKGSWDILTIKMLYVTLGNSVGCIIIPLLNKLRRKIRSI